MSTNPPHQPKRLLKVFLAIKVVEIKILIIITDVHWHHILGDSQKLGGNIPPDQLKGVILIGFRSWSPY